ncbi:MAG: hypothetical protein HW387_1792 [Parachlamydiales bacterium]|nr:hypothetical protein [Parachlamydiales bacterium]
MELADPTAHKRAILEYWTLVEFFTPYLLDIALATEEHFERVFPEEPMALPWSNQTPLAEHDSSSIHAKGYYVYLGVFSIEETADRARHVFCERTNTWQSIDWRQCDVASKLSCFARLTVTKFGVPLWGTLTLSTLPWAHGRLLNNEAASLTMESYWKGVNKLLSDLKDEFSRILPGRLVRLPKEQAAYLDHQALVKLTEILFRWAGFAPRDYPIALIQVCRDEKNSGKTPEMPPAQEIPILNSFYAQALERAAVSLDSQKGTPLDLYLSGHCGRRISLEGEEGKKAVLEALRPASLPAGRWPASPSHQLTLMQQFAVNQSLSSLAEGGLFSVNGPPGTGKTTLLREIIAQTIVARAQALAQFERAQEAFVGRRTMGFLDGGSVSVSDLHPSLLGHEMIVVSSNNTAVQNLSHELPLRRELDPSYGHASYLAPVACRLLGAEEGEGAWGLISAALGNKKNCRRLVERIFIAGSDEEPGARIWDWERDYAGPSYAEARSRFMEAQERHRILLDDIEALAHLHKEISGGHLEALYERTLSELLCAERAVEAVQEKLKFREEAEKDSRDLAALLEQRVQIWNRERPNVVKRFSNGKEWEEWSERSSVYTGEQITALETLQAHIIHRRELLNALEQLQGDAELEEYQLFECSFWVDWCQNEYLRLKAAYPDVLLPQEPFDLESAEVQKGVFYQTATLNDCRSELFIAALAFHEAWLAETLRPKGGFRGNLLAISNLLQGKYPTTTDDTRLAWQSVFVVIPLLSSTFASFERMFRYLEPQTLGWVFIDEAGQALPQAAVGAIWRAKRVLSIGDPFQIEPISAVPPEIVDGMAKHRLHDRYLAWAPSQISLQNLMDAASQYGTLRHVRDIPYWLGAPLRVHRRCCDPMFSIANEIAYEHSMVLATESHCDHALPPSCWYDVGGEATDRQFVPAQGNELLQRLIIALSAMSSPDIYVISPFREVVRQAQHLIFGNKIIKALFENKFPGMVLHAWIREAVGTVHTFQGKQAAAVFLILGADQSTFGAVEWATRKPNLLNVAVTRACDRFYIIGDYNLWRRWPYFDIAARKLERVAPSAHHPS